MQIKELTTFLNSVFPLAFQESYDNSGLLVSRDNEEVNAALLTLDITPEVIDEAIQKKADVIISHHPLIFKPLKKLLDKTPTEQMLRKLLKHDIAVYSAHTNMDSALGGTNDKLCELLELSNINVLVSKPDYLFKLIVFVPHAHSNAVREAMFHAGAGQIGKYDGCSFNGSGQGSFRAGEGATPFVGKQGEMHFEDELRVETVVPKHLLAGVLKSMIAAHPYEEVAYDIIPLVNNYEMAGLGRIGELPKMMNAQEFLSYVITKLNADHLRYAGNRDEIRKIALCSGSGASFSAQAASSNVDAYISSDFKYHEFQSAAEHLFVVDAGHYHTEKFAKEIFYNRIIEKFPKFALYLSEINTNPINLY